MLKILAFYEEKTRSLFLEKKRVNKTEVPAPLDSCPIIVTQTSCRCDTGRHRCDKHHAYCRREAGVGRRTYECKCHVGFETVSSHVHCCLQGTIILVLSYKSIPPECQMHGLKASTHTVFTARSSALPSPRVAPGPRAVMLSQECLDNVSRRKDPAEHA